MLDLRNIFSTIWPTDTEFAEDEYERGPRLQAPEQSAVLAVYEASPRLRWTTDEPTHPGLYFCRVPGGELKLVEVWRGSTLFPSGPLWFSWSDIPTAPVHNSGLEWSDRAVQPPLERS
jgi:hypothetical protein